MRLLAGLQAYQADPLVCKGCGGPLKILAYINDQISIKRILDLGLSPPGQEEPAPTRRWSVCRWTTRGGRSRPAEDT